MKKKITEKVSDLKLFLESLEVKIDDSQLESAVAAFEILKEQTIQDAIRPIKEKMEQYQKSNYELSAKLEESKQMSNAFDKVLAEKVEEIKNIKVPDLTLIEKTITDKIAEQVTLLEKTIKKVNDFEKKLDVKPSDVKINEELDKIKVVGNIFESYKTEFAKALTEIESTTTKNLNEKIDALEKESIENKKQIKTLEENLKSEKESTEITIMLENSDLSKEEKDFLYGFYEKSGLKEAKENFNKYIAIKEKQTKNVNLQKTPILKESVSGIRSAEDAGFLKKRSLINESAQINEMDQWVEQAGLNK